MTGQMTRAEAAARFRESQMCAAQSKLSRLGDLRSFFICSNERGHEQDEHTSCDGAGHVFARWKSETSAIEVWLPDGYHIL